MGVTARELLILGTRGVPARHGGFETFAESLSLYLVGRGWSVSVYCQEESLKRRRRIREQKWNGISQLFVPVSRGGSIGSVFFDAWSILDSLSRPGVVLILGYNTGIFSLLPRLFGRTVIINMDGLEWKRRKWSLPVKGWFYINGLVASWAAKKLIADHPAIEARLRSLVGCRKVSMIPYSSFEVDSHDFGKICVLGLVENAYWYTACRIEPENNVLEAVIAFSRRPRTSKLIVLGTLSKDNTYHSRIIAAANDSVRFLGPFYDRNLLRSFRYFARGYVHGHSVGGTNPSLVEALAAGNAIVAHDNEFNRWTAGGQQHFFSSEEEADEIFARLETNDRLRIEAGKAARERFISQFEFAKVMGAYEQLFSDMDIGVQGVTGSDVGWFQRRFAGSGASKLGLGRPDHSVPDSES